jgi:hypothetical protein
MLDTQLRVLNSSKMGEENARLKLENKKLVKLNKILNKKLVDLVAKRVLERAQSK